jgi:diacylglycerol kinase family enzyme
MVALHTSFLRSVPVEKRVRRSDQRRRVAVVLNAHARRVDGQTIRWISGVVPPQDLFVSTTVEEGAAIAERIVEAGYDAVLWGGGDGTFAHGIASVMSAAARSGLDPLDLPDMGVLRLGTGNAIADALGAGTATPDGLSSDLARARGAASRRTLPLLDVGGRPAMFCGFGLDAQILDDFSATVGALKKAGIAEAVKSAGVRYFLSVTSRSIPRFLTTSRPEVVAINRGAPAIKVDVDGRPVGNPIPAGRVLWRGVASLASAGTIPFYGLGLRVFPHVDRLPGRFQLRLSDAGAGEILTHLPQIWNGRFASKRLHDFLVDEVELVLARPAPFQANGDLLGDRERITLRYWKHAIPVV